MRLQRSLLAFTLVGSLALSGQQSPAIFRYISLGFTRIELGQPFANALLTRLVDDSTRALRDVAFAGADTIALRYDGARKIRAILFAYPPSYDWSKEVREYVKALGRPVVLREDGERPVAEWRDSVTTYRMWCEPASTQRRCRAELRDRARAR